MGVNGGLWDLDVRQSVAFVLLFCHCLIGSKQLKSLLRQGEEQLKLDRKGKAQGLVKPEDLPIQ